MAAYINPRAWTLSTEHQTNEQRLVRGPAAIRMTVDPEPIKEESKHASNSFDEVEIMKPFRTVTGTQLVAGGGGMHLGLLKAP